MQRHRLFAKRPKLGLVLHIFLQTACVYGSVAIIESYIRDVLCLKSTVVNASAIIYGITLPAVLSAVIGLVSDAWIGAFRGQLIGYRCWIIGALLLILSTIPQDMYNMSIAIKRILGLSGMVLAASGSGFMLPCLITYIGDQHRDWNYHRFSDREDEEKPRNDDSKRCKGGWCCCCTYCCCRRRTENKNQDKSFELVRATTRTVDDVNAGGNSVDAFEETQASRMSHIERSHRLRRKWLSSHRPMLIFFSWASVGALFGEIGFPMVLNRLSTSVAHLTSYPLEHRCHSGQTKPIQCQSEVGGTLTVADTGTGIEIFGSITGKGLDTGRLQIHSGHACNDRNIGSHLLSKSPHHDPWTNAYYEADAGKAVIYITQKHFSLEGDYPVADRVIVLHDSDGSRVSCGRIATKYHRLKWTILFAFLFVLQITGRIVFGCGRNLYRRRKPEGACCCYSLTALERSDLSWIMPISIPLLFFWAILAQQKATWKKQTEQLDRSWSKLLDQIPLSWQIPDAIKGIHRSTVMLLTITYRVLLLPILEGRKILLYKRGIWNQERSLSSSNIGKWFCFGTSLSRIGWGFFSLLVAMIFAERLEKKLDSSQHYTNTDDKDDYAKYQTTISIKDQIPQTLLLSLSEVFVMTSGITFFYDEVEPNLRATMEGIFILLSISQSLGVLIPTLSVSIALNYDVPFIAMCILILYIVCLHHNYLPKKKRMIRAFELAAASDYIPEDFCLLDNEHQLRNTFDTPLAGGRLLETSSSEDEERFHYNNPMTITEDSRNFDFKFERTPEDMSDEDIDTLELDPGQVSIVLPLTEDSEEDDDDSDPYAAEEGVYYK